MERPELRRGWLTRMAKLARAPARMHSQTETNPRDLQCTQVPKQGWNQARHLKPFCLSETYMISPSNVLLQDQKQHV